MWPTKRFCLSLSSPAFSSARSPEKPTIAFNGVRNSWLMLAKNLLFNLVVCSTCRLRTSSSRFAAAKLSMNFSFCFSPLSLRDIDCDHNFCRSAAKVESVGRDFHVHERAVFFSMPPQPDFTFGLGNIFKKRRDVLRRTNLFDRHPQKFIAGISVF